MFKTPNSSYQAEIEPSDNEDDTPPNDPGTHTQPNNTPLALHSQQPHHDEEQQPIQGQPQQEESTTRVSSFGRRIKPIIRLDL